MSVRRSVVHGGILVRRLVHGGIMEFVHVRGLSASSSTGVSTGVSAGSLESVRRIERAPGVRGHGGRALLVVLLLSVLLLGGLLLLLKGNDGSADMADSEGQLMHLLGLVRHLLLRVLQKLFEEIDVGVVVPRSIVGIMLALLGRNSADVLVHDEEQVAMA
ncbi:hypothetical protein GGR53DRAFT_481815 [Hypoxylon sp. FL1150]|nr:hypothetical protein GGR53DRAFT_481815 [Hypoxylon sp. FL1150]